MSFLPFRRRCPPASGRFFNAQISNLNNSAISEPIRIKFYTRKLDALGFFVLKFQRFLWSFAPVTIILARAVGSTVSPLLVA